MDSRDPAETSQSGGAGSGGSETGGTATSGGAPTTGGAPATRGVPPIGGGPPTDAGLPDGATTGCSDRIDCAICCEEHFGQGHGPFSSAHVDCGCGDPCYSACSSALCNTVYDFTSECLRCIAGQASLSCAQASAVCNGNEACAAYRDCVVSCL